MTKINFLSIALGLMFFLSCTKEDSNLVSANYSSHVGAMRLFYDTNVRTSTEFQSYHSQVHLFVEKLNHQIADLSDRSHFHTWITANLSVTDFPSVTYAMDKFDSMTTAGASVDSIFSDFYKDLGDLTNSSDVLYILNKDLAVRPRVNLTTPCQDGCIATVSSNLDFAENLYIFQQASPNPHIRISSYSVYCDLIENSVASFNDCMNAC